MVRLALLAGGGGVMGVKISRVIDVMGGQVLVIVEGVGCCSMHASRCVCSCC